MREATQHLHRHPLPVNDTAYRDLLIDTAGNLTAVELGKQRPDSPGTDALHHAVAPDIDKYITDPPEQPPIILAEGTRLANNRFINTALTAGHTVNIIYLNNPQADQWRKTRSARKGKTQNESWVRGRATAARNLANNPPKGVNVTTVQHPDEAATLIREQLTQ